MKSLFALFLSMACLSGYAQVSDDQIQQYINGIESPINGWLSDANAFFGDTLNNIPEGLQKKYERFKAKTLGRNGSRSKVVD